MATIFTKLFQGTIGIGIFKYCGIESCYGCCDYVTFKGEIRTGTKIVGNY